MSILLGLPSFRHPFSYSTHFQSVSGVHCLWYPNIFCTDYSIKQSLPNVESFLALLTPAIIRCQFKSFGEPSSLPSPSILQDAEDFLNSASHYFLDVDSFIYDNDSLNTWQSLNPNTQIIPMLIQLIPASSIPAVLHTISFPEYNERHSIPPSWQNQYMALQQDDLELPESWFNLDKAIGITTLLTEVTFDVPAMSISCTFVDGAVEEWSLSGDDCLRLVEEVAHDVNEATLDREREKEWEREKERAANMPLVPVKVTRHKKQRSLLMSLVAAIVPTSLSSSTSSSRLSSPPAPPPTPISPVNSRSLIPPRIRHGHSRIAVIDIYRQFALTELARRFPRGGYYTWIIQSMLRRVTNHMDQLVHRACGSPDLMMRYNPEEPDFFSITAASLPPTPSVSDDEGEGPDWSGETDTDSSSVHTPPSSHFNTLRQVSDFSDYVPRRHDYPSLDSSRHYLSEREHAAYTELTELTARLDKLLADENRRQKQLDEDLRENFCALEVKSRRRAWLNKTLVGGIGGQGAGIGLAMPFSRSPLSRVSWTSEDYEYAPDEETFPVQEYDEYERLELRIRRTRRSTPPRLFPVSEEDMEDDGEDDARELALQLEGFGIDLEGGVVCPEDQEGGGGVRVAFEVEKPHPRPRVRKHSMYRQRLSPPPVTELGVVSVPQIQPQPLPPTSILYQPFSLGRPRERVPDIEQPPVYAELDVSVHGFDSVSYGSNQKSSGEEFTLGMDLPLSVRVQDQDVFANRKGLNIEDNHGWIPPQRTSGDYLHCR